MHVSGLLAAKGPGVITTTPTATVAQVAGLLAEHRIGAVVVSGDGTTIDGVVSERDIVRSLAAGGADALARPVSAIMTAEVFTCEPTTTCDELMELMTNQRIRHVPVLVDGGLGGIVSIGDVVKNRMIDLETAARSLQDYIVHGR